MKNLIIPIFIAHQGCPHQCIFCDQHLITGVTQQQGSIDVELILREYEIQIESGAVTEIAFYGGSFTALPLKTQKELLQPATQHLRAGKVKAIRISTRPDVITVEIAKFLVEQGVSIVELGVQSLDDMVLSSARRGHTVADVTQAVEILKALQITVGLQFMPGLPLEDWASIIRTVRRGLVLLPNFIRVYPAIVLAGTPLAHRLQDGDYEPLTLKAAISRAAYFKAAFATKNIPVIRMGLQPTSQLSEPGVVVAGPYHPAFGELVDSYLFHIRVCHFLDSICPKVPAIMTICHHPKDESKLRGSKNSNTKIWKDKYPICDIRLEDSGKKLDMLEFCWDDMRCISNKYIYCHDSDYIEGI
jgi:histone acetyltransferase (RNA polymerase elongator complex component)